MTTFYIYSQNLTCQNCGKSSDHRRLGSTKQFSSEDLDTRPLEMARSVLHAQVQIRPHCGYCAPDISRTVVDVSAIVGGQNYQNQLKSSDYPALANAFLCSAILQESIGKFDEAGWAAVKAAWVCDDGQKTVAAKRVRMRAAMLFRRALAAGRRFGARAGDEDTLLVDLLRRSEQFEEATRQIELALSDSAEEVIVEKIITQGITREILEFQRRLIENGDVGRYTLAQVFKDW